MRSVLIAGNLGISAWTPAQDSTLVGVIPASSVANRMMVSSSPTDVVGNIENPASNFVSEEFVLYLRTSSTTYGLGTNLENLKIPIYEGKTIYCSFAQPGSLIFLLDDSTEISASV